jgi:hypothetical protein
MTAVIARKAFAALILMGAGMMAVTTAQAGGPQVMMYITVPLDGHAHSHVFGLRLDKEAAPPDIRALNWTSPLNRRALLDLQMGADSALRLELDRRLTWDFDRQQWHQSSLPATFTLRVPRPEARTTHEAHEAPAVQVAASALLNHATLSASLTNPLQDQSRKPLVKSLAIEP